MKSSIVHKKCASPKELLAKQVLDLFLELPPGEEMPEDIPSKWEKHGDLVLLPAAAFQNPLWLNFGPKLWDSVAAALKVNRVARKYKIKDNDFRSPNVELLKGSDGWVTHIDNKIKYTFDVTKCMFSSGNISEKLRIAKFECKEEIIVDLYAGIGYFTLPYLIHAKASLVHACEWNPDAMESLEKNLELNGVREKCIIHFGDNRKVCPEKVADRVNLGLIPSSKAGYKTACKALKPTGGILHIHGNVTSYEKPESANRARSTKSCLISSAWEKWAEETKLCIMSILSSIYDFEWNVNVLEIIHIKSYAPHINHLVLDLECRPS